MAAHQTIAVTTANLKLGDNITRVGDVEQIEKANDNQYAVVVGGKLKVYRSDAVWNITRPVSPVLVVTSEGGDLRLSVEPIRLGKGATRFVIKKGGYDYGDVVAWDDFSSEEITRLRDHLTGILSGSIYKD